jgi:hypothetical protein
LVPHAMPQDSPLSMIMQVFRDVPAIGTSLIWLALIVAAALWFAVRTVETREYVLEQ